MFNIDFVALIRWFVPSHLRDAVTLGWLRSLCAPVFQLYNEFIVKRAKALYILSHDSRVFSIEAVLNDRFDSTARSIYITKGLGKERIPIYTPAENKPVRMPIPLYRVGDYADTGIDFIVWVPTAINITTQDITEMTSLVNEYCLAGKRFNITRI